MRAGHPTASDEFFWFSVCVAGLLAEVLWLALIAKWLLWLLWG